MSGQGAGGQQRRARLADARLLLVAGPETGGDRWAEAAIAALASGAVDVLQVRDKRGDDAAIAAHVAALRGACHRAGALLLLNDHVALAASLDVDGAHVGEHDLPPGLARLLLGPERLLGLSTHDGREVRAAASRGADYVGLGPCFATQSKALERAPGGAALVEEGLAAAGRLPLFPIGGVDVTNASALVAAGARRLAVGSAVLRAPDPGGAARRLAALLSASKGRTSPFPEAR